MQNFTAAMKHLGMEEVAQAVVAFFMWLMAHCFSESVMGTAAGILAVVVLLFNIRLGYTKNRTAQAELKIAELKLKRECG